MGKPHSVQLRHDQIPSELHDLSSQVEQLPFHVRQRLLPLCERIQHYTRLHARLLRIAQEAVDQLQFDIKYMQFDLEATRRERDQLIREMRGYDGEGPEGDSEASQ